MQVARLQSLLDSLQVLLPGLFVIVVVWLGARFAVQGQISPGELVAFYGYSAFLMLPLRTATEVANKVIRGLVAGQRICRVLSVEPEVVDIEGAGTASDRSRPGRRPVRTRRPPGPAHRRRRRAARRLRGARRPARPVRRGTGAARRRFALPPRPSIRPALDRRERRQRHPVQRARCATSSTRVATPRTSRSWLRVATASAEDVLDLLDGGLAADVEERGRSFSGGQRQRLVLTRALTLDPDVLVLVEPTSAVDAHTEATIAVATAATPGRAHDRRHHREPAAA